MKIYTITGCGGIGKDSILNKLLELDKDLTGIVSVTSRPPREGEIEGINYYFKTKDEVINMLNAHDFIEHRTYNVITDKGQDIWVYGISKQSIKLESDYKYVVIVDYQGLKELKHYLKENDCEDSLISFYIDGSYQTRLQRYLSREDMTDNMVKEAIRRFNDDNKNVLPAREFCDYIINNEGKLENSVARILDIIESEG